MSEQHEHEREHDHGGNVNQSSTSQQSTTQRPASSVLAGILRDLFFTRIDYIAFEASWGKACPGNLDVSTSLDDLLLGHVMGDKNAPRAVVHYVTQGGKNVGAALGPFRVGSYTPNADGLTRVAAIDIDGGADHAASVEHPADTARQIAQNARALGVSAYLERSGGASGWHVVVLFDELVSAADARELMMRMIPHRIPLLHGGYADPDKARGVEVFPKSEKIGAPTSRNPRGGLGSQVWLPWWAGAKPGGCLLHQLDAAGQIDPAPWWPTTVEDMRLVTPETVARVLAFFREVEGELPSKRDRRIAADREANAGKVAQSKQRRAAADPSAPPSDLAIWRARVTDSVPLEAIYGEHLDGEADARGWIKCFDPTSQTTGLRRPSAGVSDGSNGIPRGTFHSFRDDRNLSIFDWLIERGRAADFKAAAGIVATITGIPVPGPRWVDDVAEYAARVAQAGAIEAAEARAAAMAEEAAEHAAGTLVPDMAADDSGAVDLSGPPDDDGSAAVDSMLAGWDAHAAQLKAAAGLPGSPSSAPGGAILPEINVDDGDFARLEDAAWNALQVANTAVPRFFRFSGSAANIIHDEQKIPSIHVFDDPVRMRSTLARIARWFKLVGAKGEDRKAAPAHPPFEISRALVANREPPLPVLHRITEFPFFAADGSLCLEPGYHANGRGYYSPAEGFRVPRVPMNPTADDVGEAMRWVDELICDFPFTDPSERAHAICLFLALFARDLIDGVTPIYNIEAPTEGTGKGKLVEALLVPALGHAPVSRPGATTEEEWEKKLVTALLPAPALILWDNLEGDVSSGALASALTQEIWSARILGGNKEGRFRIRCVWAMTGNNIRLSNDLLRRTIRIRIDAKMSHPSMRTGFKHELPHWAYIHRAELVWAALTIIQAWVANGSQLSSKRIGSYEKWAGVMGGILENVGVPGFLANRLAVSNSTSASSHPWRAFAGLWWDKYAIPGGKSTEQVGTKQLLALAEDADLPLRGKNDQGRKVSLGELLMSARDRVFEISEPGTGPGVDENDDGSNVFSVRLEYTGISHHAVQYRLARVVSPNRLI